MEEIAIKTGGYLSAIVGIGHCFFYRGFGWNEDFEKTRVLTARVLYTILCYCGHLTAIRL
ncbi:MAG: hypothetical protein A2075_06525 [Geobacteraceae bacterium GWC2_58_44]|nr:MAG: hypothetical protein A2075_06525 [Geobacteraceae bacterium GWC2_58_44]HBG05415.1 hypothetical protein [Geobacter sp.]